MKRHAVVWLLAVAGALGVLAGAAGESAAALSDSSAMVGQGAAAGIGSATAPGQAHRESAEDVDLEKRGRQTADAAEAESAALVEGRSKLEQALSLRYTEAFEQARQALEAIGRDESLPRPIRGAALTDLARAHENVYPSWATEGASGGTSNPLAAAGRRILAGHENGKGGSERFGFSHTAAEHRFLNRSRAVELYREAAALGNETAQFRMGTLYASGALGVETDPVQAVLHYYFASLNGHAGASMALGFRHSIGLGVPKDCKAAVVYYELAANAAVDKLEAEGVGPMNDRERLSLDRKSRGYAGRSSRSEDEEVVDYYKHAAEKGDVSALLALGQIYFFGARGVERDHRRAVGFFRVAAANGDPVAQANLGHMLVKGMGTQQDLEGALGNFSAAAKAGSASAFNGLAYMHLYGLGVEQDVEKARKYFYDAADAGNAEAHYNLGAMHVSGVGVRRRNFPTALNYFTLAAQKGHVLAMHKLAQMNLHGVGIPVRNCDHALQLFKAVAERGDPVRLLARGYSFWNNEDDVDSALQVYLVAAELGFEVAQSNAAWLLDNGADLRGGVASHDDAVQGPGAGGAGVAAESMDGGDSAHVSDDPIMEYVNAVQDLVVENFPAVTGSLDSLRLYQLAAEQGNVEARLRIGDFYYYGLGGEQANFELAAHHYKQASDLHNAQAMFNLGFMHQHGVGLPRDFHLAKRFYDAAESAHPDAKVPVSLALSGLWAHRVFRAIVFKEISPDLPPAVGTIANWFAFFAGDQVESDAVGPAKAAAGLNPAGASGSEAAAKNDEDDGLADLLLALEDDTIVAICLFILMCFVLMMRSREQRRRLEVHRQRQQQQQQPHLHQD